MPGGGPLIPGGGPRIPGGGPLIPCGGPPIMPPGGGPPILIPGGPGIRGLGGAAAASPPRPYNHNSNRELQRGTKVRDGNLTQMRAQQLSIK